MVSSNDSLISGATTFQELLVNGLKQRQPDKRSNCISRIYNNNYGRYKEKGWRRFTDNLHNLSKTPFQGNLVSETVLALKKAAFVQSMTVQSMPGHCGSVIHPKPCKSKT